MLTLCQFIELYVTTAVPVDALKESLPLIDIFEEIAKLVDVDRPGIITIEHF